MSFALKRTPSRQLRKRSTLYEYQEEAIRRVTTSGQQAIFLKPGLGKTVIALTVLRDLGVSQAIVFAPAQVVEMDVWGTEAARWEHLESTTIVPVVGDAHRRLELLEQASHIPNCVCVLSYHNLVWYIKTLRRRAEERWGAVIFDELSRMKSPGAKWFRGARNWLKNIPVRMGLTGTPVGNHLMDVWGEMYQVAGIKPLGGSFVDFKNKFFYPVDFHRWKWLPLPGAQERIQSSIKPFAFSIAPENGPSQPLVKVNEIRMELPEKVRKVAATLQKQLRVELESKEELLACSATVVAQKLRQFAGGAVYLGDHSIEILHDEKLKAVQEILEEQQGDPVLLFYEYRHEKSRLLEWFPQGKVLGETCTMAEWDAGKVELMVAHPQSMGFGLNLQEGGSTIIWYTLPWSVELWEQATARLARQGQKSKYVTSHVLLAGPVDEMVLRVLRNKGRVQQEMLDSLV